MTVEAIVGDREDAAAPSGGGMRAIAHDVLSALGRLDIRLARAAAVAAAAFGPAAATDPYRGLYVGPDEVERLLARAPGAPTLAGPSGTPPGSADPPDAPGSRLAWLERTFDLSPFEMDVVLVALAPDVDLRYERLYGYLHDDVSKRRPTVDLALNLLCESVEAKLDRRRHFSSEAPLVRHRLIHLLPDPSQVQPPVLAHYLKLDDQIVRALLEQGGLDPRLQPFCRLIEATPAADPRARGGAISEALSSLVTDARLGGRPFTLYLSAPRDGDRREAALAVAHGAGAPLLTVDLRRAVAADPDLSRTIPLLFREAALLDAVLYLDPLDALRGEERAPVHEALLDAVAESGGIAVLAGSQPWVPPGSGPTGTLTVPLGTPEVDERRATWEAVLASRGIRIGADDLDTLADRFRVSAHQIADTVDTACAQARYRAARSACARETGDLPTAARLFAAARAQSGHELAALARKIVPVHTWADIVLPGDVEAQLREICQQVVHRHRVLGEWGFGRKLSYGKGVNALFAGPAGTGKTMAAEVLANALELDLYTIDLAQVVDKYIGETEKRLDRIFAAAGNADGILFFDEADALFGKRSEVRDSHDRYANIEIAYLLQKIEQYDGIAILATNFRQNIDEAFTRRLGFVVEFPFPDEAHRARIWRALFPADTPKDDEIDFALLARLRLAGGNIKNVVLGAAYLAAADGGRVSMAHLVHATRRECQKIGKILPEAELGAYPALAAAAQTPDES
jgi:hypothetical protein